MLGGVYSSTKALNYYVAGCVFVVRAVVVWNGLCSEVLLGFGLRCGLWRPVVCQRQSRKEREKINARRKEILRLASELYPGVSGGFLGKVWLACLLREDFKIFPAMPSTN